MCKAADTLFDEMHWIIVHSLKAVQVNNYVYQTVSIIIPCLQVRVEIYEIDSMDSWTDHMQALMQVITYHPTECNL